MNIEGCVRVAVEDLAPGVVMASGVKVASIEIGTRRLGNQAEVTFVDKTVGRVGRRSRVWVRAGSIVQQLF